jgi:transcriptional regulator with XRE-family HTH domain
MKDTFGQYIRKLRKQNNLTLTQLAAELDLDSANLSKIENGIRKFDEKRLELLAERFELNLDVLKEEYFSEVFAKILYETNCSSKTLVLAEEKVKYLKSMKAKQGELL